MRRLPSLQSPPHNQQEHRRASRGGGCAGGGGVDLERPNDNQPPPWGRGGMRARPSKRQSAPRQGIEEGVTAQTTIILHAGGWRRVQLPDQQVSKTSWRRRRVQPPNQQDQPPQEILSRVATAQMTISRREGFHPKPVNPIESSRADLSCRPKPYQAVLSPTSPLFCHHRAVLSPSNLWTVGPSQVH
jgi:hypothetical protein